MNVQPIVETPRTINRGLYQVRGDVKAIEALIPEVAAKVPVQSYLVVDALVENTQMAPSGQISAVHAIA
jgi:hypothetical protein